MKICGQQLISIFSIVGSCALNALLKYQARTSKAKLLTFKTPNNVFHNYINKNIYFQKCDSLIINLRQCAACITAVS